MSKFVVSARKYRPRRFKEVIGQEHVTETLETALSNDKLAHAFIFTGPRGVGKTTCARILAKVINCENKDEHFNPCDECSSCLSFDRSNSFNIIELDAASNNGVEHIRTLNDQVRLQPQQGSYKVFIIDEVHMLSQAAFNAFLKTLEEPPPYAIFILATTEKHKIIPTILSRCQIFDFRRIPIEKIIGQLKDIAQKEGMDIEEDALFTIAEKGDGSMRDALSIFDRLVSSSSGKVTYDDVVERLNILDYDFFFKTVNAMVKEDGNECLLVFDEIFKLGFEGDHFINGLGDHLRQLFVCKDPQTLELADVSDQLKERYKNQAELLSISDLLTAMDICNQADIQYQKAKNKRLHIEMALLKLAYFNRRVTGDAPKIQEKKTPDATAITHKAVLPPSSPKETPPKEKEVQPSKSPPPTQAPPKPESATNQGNSITDSIPSVGSVESLLNSIREESQSNTEVKQLNLAEVNQVWSKYAEHTSTPSVKSVLKKAKIQVSGKVIQVTVASRVAKETIINEKGIMQEMRTAFNTMDIELNVVIDKSQFPDTVITEPKRYLTPMEKYDVLTDENPLFRDMVQTLNLKINNNQH